MSKPRNVLLLIADDWSPLTRCYGNDVVQTPNIDRLATRGTVFDHAFCTTPSCAASRANILTGYYSHQHGQYGHCHDVHGFRTHDWVRSVPAVLKDAGVRTGLIGKSHIAPPAVYPFDVWETREPWSNQSMTEGIRGFLADAAGRPFFLHAASMYPHRIRAEFPAERNADEFAATDVAYDPADVVVPPFLPDVPEVRADLAAYYRYISRYDDFIGRAVAELEAAGRANDTLVLVMSDHGMPFPGAKASSFDGGHHCPLIVIDPMAKRRGVHCQAMVNWCDIAPTLYAWLGIDDALVPDDLPGRSLLPVLNEENPADWDATYFSHCFHEVNNYFPYRVLRGQRYKYVRNLAYQLPMPLPTDLFRSPTWMAVREQEIEQLGERSRQRMIHQDRQALYDLEADPAETQNLVDEPELQGIAERMRSTLLTFRQNTGDPWLETSFQEGETPDPQAQPTSKPR